MVKRMVQTLEAARVSPLSIPVIDVAGLASQRLADRKAVAGEIRAACLHNGFFYIRNHRIPRVLIDDVVRETKAFFALPLSAKLALDKRHSRANRGYEPLGDQTLEAGAPPDRKEGFYIGVERARTIPVPPSSIRAPINGRPLRRSSAPQWKPTATS
jgi:isopenicillin N synthase-like dioxygenase